MKTTQVQVQHLLLRMGFGDSITTIKKYIGQTPKEIIKDQLGLVRKYSPIKVDLVSVSNQEMKMMDEESKRETQKIRRSEVKSLNTEWIKEMASAQSGINEKMAFFWHDHFPCKSNNGTFIDDYLTAIRKHALGNFGDLLRAVSKSPAMLQYLNNQQNKRSAPNENFAREVMELFTLGRDNGYTEEDISEAARAFTGWTFSDKEGFIERKKTHDPGIKTVLGQTGTFKGDDILNMLLAKKQTAYYISEKWVKFFVNEKGNDTLQKEVAEALYDSDYDIKTGLKVLFSSKEFFDQENIGKRIKSPIELIVGLQRQLGLRIENQDSLLYLEKMLGQTLFDPPNVAGWPDGKDWIDSASLMFRIHIPQLLFKAAVLQNVPDSFDDNDQFKLKGKLKKIEIKFDLTILRKNLEGESIGSYLIQSTSDWESSPFDLIDQIIFYTSKPEYQLC